MTDRTYPCLIDIRTNVAHPLSGRIITIGSSASCQIVLKDKGQPDIAAHMMFQVGHYKLSSLSSDVKILVNGKPVSSDYLLKDGDEVNIGKAQFTYRESSANTGTMAPAMSSMPISDLVSAVVSLLRNKEEDVTSDLVVSVSRLIGCDAARLVIEDAEKGERKTIARYPVESGLDRFSNRAIDFAKNASQTVLVNDTDWKDTVDPKSSLERNLIASVLCAPLTDAGRVLGYLYLDRLQNGRPFTEEDRKFCDSLLPLFSELLANSEHRRRQAETIARLQASTFETSGGMIYESAVMAKTVALAAKLAATDSPILIYGETGTGKELMARFIHGRSPRSSKPFKAINCGAIPENLIESELFGHEKGSFTGATQRKIGLFEAATGGTVFLDEVAELPLGLQVKLLRVLQDSEIVRVGGTENIKTDVRIVAATNKKLEDETAAGRFRQDLFFRLNVLTIGLAPLRERGQDTVLLSEYFVKKYCQQFGLPVKTFLSSAQNALIAHHWPGNIRELENVVQKAILLSNDNRIAKEHIQITSSSLLKNASGLSSPVTLKDARSAAEKEIITQTLVRTKGNVSMASKLLDIDRKWLMKLMEELGVNADDYRG
ncbi:MAG TPA: sigma 54-interacting transcriptional regulator [Chitinivibrionales bacterium]|nr:sigma 54-interacting transcriptional regulator [Chitinivibrionales bacterium]